ALAYAEIHRRGVLHGDIHPGNLLVGRDGKVSIVDLGLAQLSDAEPGSVMRGGVGFFMEPEYARATLAHRPPSPPTPAGEQFALAALLYMLATGRHYTEFTLEQEEMFRQIAAARPLPFAEAGAEPWPALEAVLARALATEPAARHRDMAAF